MSDLIRVRVTTCTGFAGCQHEDYLEFDREDWESMSDDQKEEECKEMAFAQIEWSWEEVSD